MRHLNHCRYCNQDLDEHSLDEIKECYYKLEMKAVEPKEVS